MPSPFKPKKKKDPIQTLLDSVDITKQRQFTPTSTSNPRSQGNSLQRDPGFRQFVEEQNKPDPNSTTKNYKDGLKSITLPDGTEFKGSPEEMLLVERYYSMKRKKAANEKQMRAEANQALDRQQIQAEETAKRNPQTATEEQLAQLTQPISAENTKDAQISQSIEQNLAARQASDISSALYANPLTLPLAVANTFANPNAPPPLLNKATGLVKEIPFGPQIIKEASKDKKIRDYLQNYNNKQNYGYVKENIESARSNMNRLIIAARISKSPIESQGIITQYREALGRLQLANEQLQRMADTDQGEYVDTIRQSQIELNNYMQDNVPLINIMIIDAFRKNNPNYDPYGNEANLG